MKKETAAKGKNRPFQPPFSADLSIFGIENCDINPK
jgi:hypothetical protein